MQDQEESIYFFSEDITFQPKDAVQIRKWLQTIASKQGFIIETLNYIFCNDQYLLQINQDYLQHDTYTDVITFDYTEEEAMLIGDIFISIERIEENARQYAVKFDEELLRVMAHGLLHLIGYGDKSEEETAQMRIAEEEALKIYASLSIS